MAVVYFGSFSGSSGAAFEWTGSGENAALEVWASNSHRVVTVDDTGPTVLLKWDRYDENTLGGLTYYDSGQAELVEGYFVRFPGGLDPFPGVPYAPTVIDDIPAGMWESDEYGRPFNLNDLLA